MCLPSRPPPPPADPQAIRELKCLQEPHAGRKERMKPQWLQKEVQQLPGLPCCRDWRRSPDKNNRRDRQGHILTRTRTAYSRLSLALYLHLSFLSGPQKMDLKVPELLCLFFFLVWLHWINLFFPSVHCQKPLASPSLLVSRLDYIAHGATSSAQKIHS